MELLGEVAVTERTGDRAFPNLRDTMFMLALMKATPLIRTRLQFVL